MHYRSKSETLGERNVFRILKLTSAFLRAQPIQGLPCQPVEGLHSYFQVLDLRIFRFVVAKPRKRLSEHHHRRNPRPRNLGCVMQWPRG
jgi:hypothetical protein